MANDKRLYRTTRFATVPDWLIGKVSSSSLSVYVALDRLTFPDGKADPTRREIADKVGLSESTVKKAIRELEAADAVVRRERVVNGTTLPNEYVLRRDPPGAESRGGSESAPPGAKSAPSRAGNQGEPRENLGEEPPVAPPRRIAAPLPVVDHPAPATVDRKGVTVDERFLASDILTAFNEVFGTSFHAPGHVAKIVMRLREQPGLTLDDHRAIIEANARAPWWKGPPSPSVVYGNDAQFERAMLAGSERSANLSGAEAQRVAEEEAERMRAEAEVVEGEVVGEEDG